MGRSLKKGPYVEDRLLARVHEMNQKGDKRVIHTGVHLGEHGRAQAG
jgi:small subunit ribosomal protein S19